MPAGSFYYTIYCHTFIENSKWLKTATTFTQTVQPRHHHDIGINVIISSTASRREIDQIRTGIHENMWFAIRWSQIIWYLPISAFEIVVNGLLQDGEPHSINIIFKNIITWILSCLYNWCEIYSLIHFVCSPSSNWLSQTHQYKSIEDFKMYEKICSIIFKILLQISFERFFEK